MGRSRDVRSGRPRDGQIESLGDVLGTLEGDVLGTSWGPIFASWGDDYTTGCLLDYAYFKDDFRLITADLSKQKVLATDPKAIQQIIFTGQVDDEALTVFYILEKPKETILELAKGTLKVQ